MWFEGFRSKLCLVALCGACGSAQSHGEPAAVPAGTALSSSAPRSTGRAAPRLEKTYTGRGVPTLSVKSRFPIDQYVFLDWKVAGKVPPGQSVAIEVAPGTHTVTSADSADPDDNAVSITEAFEAGFAYSYEIAAE